MWRYDRNRLAGNGDIKMDMKMMILGAGLIWFFFLRNKE